MSAKRKQTSEQQALEAAAAQQTDGAANILALKSGVVLKVRRVSTHAIREAVMRIEEPQPPMVFLEDKGREEPNPEHPDYKKAMAQHAEAIGLAAANVTLLMGTTVESVPDDVPKQEEDDWIDNLEFFGITVDKNNPRARYLAWLRFCAINTDEDMVRTLYTVAKVTGVTEEDVDQAVQSFRRATVWGADKPEPSE